MAEAETFRALARSDGRERSAAKQVLQRLPGGSFNAANISHYRAGRSLPRPAVLKALSAVLDVDAEDLAPSQANGVVTLAIFDDDNHGEVVDGVSPDDPDSALAPNGLSLSSIPEFHIKDLPGGEALLQINQRLSWSTVIRILQALKGQHSGAD